MADIGDDPVQVKFNCKEVDPCENSRAVYIFISPHNSGTVIDSEKSLINANIKLTMGFPTSHHQGRASPLTFPKWGSETKICRRNFDQKQLKVCNKVYLSKNFQPQKL